MLNKSSGNMYEFVTHTWNTIKGECPHGCSYCYMKKWGKQPSLHFDNKEIKTDLGTGNYIFVGSSCDMFADDIPIEWIMSTLMICERYNNEYFFQSKNPKRFSLINAVPLNYSLCTTIETNRWYADIMNNCSKPVDRAVQLKNVPTSAKRYVTIEPIMDFDLNTMIDLIKFINPSQVNIGADTGRNGLPEPSKQKLNWLIGALSGFTTVHEKANLVRLLK